MTAARQARTPSPQKAGTKRPWASLHSTFLTSSDGPGEASAGAHLWRGSPSGLIHFKCGVQICKSIAFLQHAEGTWMQIMVTDL